MFPSSKRNEIELLFINYQIKLLMICKSVQCRVFKVNFSFSLMYSLASFLTLSFLSDQPTSGNDHRYFKGFDEPRKSVFFFFFFFSKNDSL